MSSEEVEPHGTPLETLCARMVRLLKYEAGERDAIYLHHFIGINWPDGKVWNRKMWPHSIPRFPFGRIHAN